MSDLKSALRKLHKLAWGPYSSVDEIKNECFDAWNELIEISENRQPTIADFLAQQKPMLDKTKSKMVSVASLEKFMRGE